MDEIMAGLTALTPPALPRGIPSTTTSGALEPLMELIPRTLTVAPPCGLSLFRFITCSPETRPCSSDSKLPEELWAMSSPFIDATLRSEEHTSELQSLMRISYAVFCLKKKTSTTTQAHIH